MNKELLEESKRHALHCVLLNQLDRHGDISKIDTKTLAEKVNEAFEALVQKTGSGCANDCAEEDKGPAPYDFSDALKWLKQGKPVCRAGWNGKGQYVILIPGEHLAKSAGYGFGELVGEFSFGNVLALKNAQNVMQPGWVPSMGDLMASDWQIAE